jgi:hypothetical protein
MRLPWLLAGLIVLGVPALVWADDPPKVKDKDVGKSYAVPYRLTDSSHILVRLKINGKGPYNFIVDTGAPFLFVTVPVAKKLGITPEKKGMMNKLERLEIEGGPVHTDFKCLIETPFQLEGMNAMGLAGVELHGIIGYTLLAHYKMEIDFTKDRMTWTKLDFQPPAPESIGKGNVPGGLDMLANLMKMLANLTGNKGAPQPGVRGFLGVELGEKDGAVLVESVLAKGPAASGGLRAGDRIEEVQGKNVTSRADILKQLAEITAGQIVRLNVTRDGAKKEITITAGEGL